MSFHEWANAVELLVAILGAIALAWVLRDRSAGPGRLRRWLRRRLCRRPPGDG